GRVTCPPWLPATAKREWKRLAPRLMEVGLLTPLDVACFACYCLSVASVITLTQRIEAEGATYEANGLTKHSPLVPMRAQAMQGVRLFGERFGCAPLSRQRLDVPGPPQPPDPFEQFLSDIGGTN